MPWLKFTAGGRFDQFFYDINDRVTPGGTPNISNGISSPKVGVAITPVKGVELFANYGQGFRSIDVPLELIGNPGLQPFKIVSTEGGVQFTYDRFKFLADYWTTDSANEGFQAAPGLPETFLGKARRDGFDLDGRFYVMKDPANTVSLFANFGGVRARLLDSAPAYYVPNVPNYVANVGVDFNVATGNAETLSGTAYVTFVGKKPLTEDGQITTSPYQRVTAKLAYSWPSNWTVFTQATWYPGDRLSETRCQFWRRRDGHFGRYLCQPAADAGRYGGRDLPLPDCGCLRGCIHSNTVHKMTNKNLWNLVFALASIGFVAHASDASAHDIWLTLNGDAGSRRAVINYGHPDDRPPAFADKVVDLFEIKSSEKTSLRERPEAGGD